MLKNVEHIILNFRIIEQFETFTYNIKDIFDHLYLLIAKKKI